MIAWSALTLLLAAAPESRAYALIVAYNGAPEPEMQALRYADDDGVRYYELFRTITTQSTFLSVLDDDTQRQAADVAAIAQIPTHANVSRAFSDINSAMEEDVKAGNRVTFYLVYTGHGGISAEHEGFVTLHDGKLTRRALYDDIIGRSRATYNHVIIDACDSYFMVSARGAKPWRSDRTSINPELIAEYTAAHVLDRYPNTGVLVSTAGAKESHEWSRFNAGVFSYEVRSALVGAADINGDGRIAYSEVAAYVSAANLRVDSPKARLTVYAKAPAANLSEPIFDLARMRTASFMQFAAADAGRFEVEDERGVRYLDMNKSPEHAVTIGLVPGPRYYVRRDGQETEVTSSPASVTTISEASWKPTSMMARDATSDALATGLYQVAYGPSFYAGFVATSGDPPVSTTSSRFAPLGVTAEQPSTMSTQRIFAWGTASVAAASAIGAIVYFAVRDDGSTTTTTTDGSSTGNGNANGNAKKDGDPTVQQAITAGDSLTPVYVLGGVAVAAGITSAILFLYEPQKRTHVGPSFSLVPTVGGAFVSSGFTF